MKKKLFSLIAIFLVSVMCTSMAACDLVTTNAQRDMKQVVATVQIDDSVERDSITKRQLVNAFLNTGYSYLSQGYTYEQTFGLMMDLLVNRRILVQQAKLDLPVINADATGVEKFLTAEEINKCKYEVVKAVNEVIDSYEKELVKEEDTEDEEDEEFEEFPTPPARRQNISRNDEDISVPVTDFRRSNNKVVNINATTQLAVVLVKPEKFENAADVADHLRQRRTVVLNLEQTNKEIARRVVDFLSGVTYAQDGKIKKVANSTYIITPYNVDIMGDLIDELENSGLYI